MEFIGEHLKEQRIKNKISILKVSKDLKISRSVLEEIENDILPDYLDKVFIIGHVRSYAKYLNLDSEIIIKNYKIQKFGYNSKSEIEIQKPIQSNSFFLLNKNISFVSIILISAFFYLFFVQSENIEQKFAMTPDIPENFVSIYEEAEMQIELDIKQKNSEKEMVDNELVVSPLENKSNLSSAIASLPDLSNKTDNNIVTLKFVDSTWIQLRDENDEIILSRLMDKDDEYSYNLSKILYLTVGNAGNLIISIDGMIRGKAGKSGEIIDSLLIDKNFNN